MRIFLLVLVLFGFTACGYSPSSKFARDVLGEKISTSIVISAQDPENTVIIKDAIDEAIIEVFHASLRDRARSDTHLVLNIESTSYTPVVYDKDGFVITYRMSVSLDIVRYHSGIAKKYRARGMHDFSVEPNAVVTDLERFKAIQVSAIKAIRSFVAQLSAEGARAKK